MPQISKEEYEKCEVEIIDKERYFCEKRKDLEVESDVVFNMRCQKHFTKLQKMKNTQSEIKPIKIGKRPGTMYCFGCKVYTQNFRPKEVKMTNKVLREKSHCAVCKSNKSRFLKQKIN